MANFPQGFNITSKEPIDYRIVLTKEGMRNIKTATQPSVYFAMCSDDGCLYLYNVNNTEDPETGKFRKFEGGGGGEPAAYLKSATVSGNTLTLKNKDDSDIHYTPDLSAYRTSAAQDSIDNVIKDRISSIEGKEEEWDAKSVVSGEGDDTNWRAIKINGIKKFIPTGGGGEPTQYLKDAKVEDEKLTINKKTGGDVELDVSTKADVPDEIPPWLEDYPWFTINIDLESKGLGPDASGNVKFKKGVYSFNNKKYNQVSKTLDFAASDTKAGLLTVEGKKKLDASINKAVEDLVNYYTKNETYTKEEVNELISKIEKLKVVVLDNLPETGEENVLYLIRKETPEHKKYCDEYLWIKEDNRFEQIGNTTIDLSEYRKSADQDVIDANKLDLLGVAPGTTDEPYRLPFFFRSEVKDNKIIITAETISLDNKKTRKDYTMEILPATETTAGLISAADKNKLDAAVQPGDLDPYAKTEDVTVAIAAEAELRKTADEELDSKINAEKERAEAVEDKKLEKVTATTEKTQVYVKKPDGTQGMADLPEGAAIDTEMSDTSVNAVQNKVIKKYVDDADKKKIDLLGNEEISGKPYNFTYFYDQNVDADKITVKAHTITLDNTKSKNVFTMDVNAATSTTAGLLNAADKIKIDEAKTKLDDIVNVLCNNPDFVTAIANKLIAEGADNALAVKIKEIENAVEWND